jgi:hypothetical protein
MKSYVYEGDDWMQGGEMITSPETLARIAAVVERTILIVEHRHYRSASSPTLMRMQASYDIAQTRKREKKIHVRRIHPLADVHA